MVLRISPLLLLVSCLCAQEPDETLSGARFRVHAGVIISRAYSNVKTGEQTTENSVEKWSAGENGNQIKAGFCAGAELLFFPKEQFKGVLGLSISQNEAAYHYSYASLSKSTRPGFTDLLKESEYDYREKFTALNISAGIRNQVQEHFFFSTLMVLYRPMRVTQSFSGFNRNTYSNNSGAEEQSTIYITEPGKKVKGAANLSLRLRFERQFDLLQKPLTAYISRNFGLIYKLPWWEVGATLSL